MARFGGRTERVERRTIDGITLEYEDSGVGEPVVFIHGALIADAFRPLLSEGGLPIATGSSAITAAATAAAA